MTANRAQNRQTENKPRRVPVSGLRDILAVYGKDPAKEYRFVKAGNEGSMRIATFKRGGWEFTQAGDHGNITVGDECVYKSEKSNGSVVRYPVESDKHGQPQWLWLMEIPKEWYDEDQKSKSNEIDKLESTITGKRSSDDNELGQYGEVKVQRK